MTIGYLVRYPFWVNLNSLNILNFLTSAPSPGKQTDTIYLRLFSHTLLSYHHRFTACGFAKRVNTHTHTHTHTKIILRLTRYVTVIRCSCLPFSFKSFLTVIARRICLGFQPRVCRTFAGKTCTRICHFFNTIATVLLTNHRNKSTNEVEENGLSFYLEHSRMLGSYDHTKTLVLARV